MMGWGIVTAVVRRRWASGALLLLALAAILMPGPARAWWNDEWSLRKKITIDTSSAGAAITDQIGTTPVLVRLHLGNFRFGIAKEDGSDLRFIAADDKTPLKYHVEKFDGLLGEALIWVSVPDLKPGARTELWLYYGNRKATSAADPKGSYDPDTVLVYHFTERGTPAQDSSAWSNHAQSAGVLAEDALIGTGLRLDGQTPLMLPASPSLAVADGGELTWSAWIKMAAPQPNAAIYSRSDGASGLVIGLDNGTPFVEVTVGGNVQRAAGTAPIAASEWHHMALVAIGPLITLYLDGEPAGILSTGLPALSGPASLGGAAAAPPAPPPPSAAAPSTPGAEPAAPAPPAPTAPAAATAVGFAGDIDELQISKVARPAGFIKLAAIGQGPNPGKLTSFGLDEETASWLSGYFAVILKSVTLDGWVVIGVLLIMAVISWVVMIDKARYLSRQAKANERFLKHFRVLAVDLTAVERGSEDDIPSLGGRLKKREQRRLARNSSLYRIFRIGVDELRNRFATGHAQSRRRDLSAPAIAAIRAGLDSGLVREIQGLNRMMVVLTIAISGGPFLGLLGTVVGVMITFAAIAASGDVNVNAIAPGIAAALVATVTGLGVAIPALFGYNYLISRIKDLTSDLQVFVDEFVTKMAEAYHDRDHHQQVAAE
jgi:biopolymer transport protein ExbB